MSVLRGISERVFGPPSRPVNENFLPPSLSRKVWHVFCKCRDAIVSLFSLRRAPISETNIQLINQKAEAESDPYLQHAVARIRDNKTLDNISVATYCQKLAAKHGAQFVGTFLTPEMMPTLEDLPAATSNKIMIPIVLKGTARNHIVAVFYDQRTNSLEYYDPKGLSIEDRHDECLLNTNKRNISLPEVIEIIQEKYQTERALLGPSENLQRHQKDSHNCGVYVYNFFERRLQPKQDFNRVVANGRSDTLKMREEMIAYLAK